MQKYRPKSVNVVERAAESKKLLVPVYSGSAAIAAEILQQSCAHSGKKNADVW